MKILGIVCSPRKSGNTEILVQETLDSAQECGANVDLFSLSGIDIKPCCHCLSCLESFRCKINDEMQVLIDKMVRADAIIMGTPVYFLNVSSQAKTVIDRTYCLRNGQKLSGKLGAAVIVASSMGRISAWQMISGYFWLQNMLTIDAVMGKARDKGEIINDLFAMACAKELGVILTDILKNNRSAVCHKKGPLYQHVRSKYELDSSFAEND